MPKDSDTTLEELKNEVKKFCEDRDWDQFHTPKELAIGLIIEAAELLEIFRYKSRKEVEELLKDERKFTEIKDELADVLFLALRIAQKYDIDVSTAFYDKLRKSEKKYPIEKVKGSNKKYTEY